MNYRLKIWYYYTYFLVKRCNIKSEKEKFMSVIILAYTTKIIDFSSNMTKSNYQIS